MLGALSDKNIDAAKQLNNTYQITTRTLGAGQALLGGAGVAGSVVTAPVSCATGIGCVANAVVGTVSLDATYAGAKQAVSGNPESTFLNQGLQSLGLSLEAAGLVEAALGVGSAATVGAVVSKGIDDAVRTVNAAVTEASVGANRGVELVEGALSLIGANRAVIDPRKLTEYALNPAHPVGGNKARVFESALGFTKNNADDLMRQLRQGVMNNTPIPGKVDQFGSRFTVDIPVTGPAGSGVVRSGWIYKPGSNVPEMTTIFVK